MRTLPMALPEVWLRPNETSVVYARPQVPCRFMRARAYLRPSEEVSYLIELRGLRVGNQMVFPRETPAMSLAATDFSGCATPTVSVGQDLALELGLAPGVVGFERAIQIVAFVEARQMCCDGHGGVVSRLERELATEKAKRAELEQHLERMVGLHAGESRLRGELELQLVALRAELEGRKAWRRELAERRARARSSVRAPVVSVLVDLDDDV
jgi:hypothetical protein